MPISPWRRCLHWLSAAAILLMLPLGLWMTHSDLSSPAAIAASLWKFSLHKTVGVLVAALTILRLVAMVSGNGFVPSHHGRLENALSAAVQSYFLLALVILPITGLAMHFLSQGAAPIWILPEGVASFPPAPRVVEMASAIHEFIAKGMIVAFILHLAGVLKHRFIDRDASLARMLSSKTTTQTVATGNADGRAAGMRIGALVAGMLVAGGALTQGATEGDKSAVNLQTGESEFVSRADASKIQITAVQGGDTFEANFRRFEVRYSGQSEPVLLNVAIDSASFESGMAERDDTVSGAEWLDAAAFPLVTWTATAFDRNPDGGWTASGELSIRGITASVPVNFILSEEEGHKRMKGNARFDRFDLQLGTGEFGTEDSAGRTIDVAFDIQLHLQ